jgi:1,4-dihydroxy-2-naphthoyl-CoA hydrolase
VNESGAYSARADTFVGLLGIEDVEAAEGRVTARTPVRPELLQDHGIVHGGVYASIAETLCSWATGEAVRENGEVALGMSNSSTFLRPIATGNIVSLSTLRHRGRTTWIWDTEFSDDEGRVCALVRMTVAVRPSR